MTESEMTAATRLENPSQEQAMTETMPAVRQPAVRPWYVPRNLDDAARLSKIIYDSGLAPRSLRSPQAICVVLAMGAELNLSPWQAMNGIDVIEGKPCPSAATLVGLCKGRQDICRYFRNVETSDELSVWETWREGEPKATRLEWTIEKARKIRRRGKLLVDGDNWRNHPDAMLNARCSSQLARMVYQDLCAGMYDPDEIGEAPTRDIQAQVSDHAEAFHDEAPIVDSSPLEMGQASDPTTTPPPSSSSPSSPTSKTEPASTSQTSAQSAEQSPGDAPAASCDDDKTQIIKGILSDLARAEIPATEWDEWLQRASGEQSAAHAFDRQKMESREVSLVRLRVTKGTLSRLLSERQKEPVPPDGDESFCEYPEA